jgi:UDP-N-acetylmuramyl pentapeptide phosphotransferase/UDP-N-acetylglucosamine-1-phosphate transferase
VLLSSSLHFVDFNNFLGLQASSLFITLPVTVFMMLAIINSYNLIDGIDGLASIVGIVIFSAYATIFYMLEINFYFLISLSFAGVLFAYLRYNFSRTKKIFMGDTGSMIIGFCIAFLTVKFMAIDASMAQKLPFLAENKIMVILSIIFIPIFDTLRVIGVRLLNNKSPFYPDRNHIHHILIDSGLKHYKASLFLAVLNVSLIALVVFLSSYFNSFEMIVFALVIFTLFLVLFHKLKSNLKSSNDFKKVINLVNYFF